MAEKKYLDLVGLAHYDEKIKAHVTAEITVLDESLAAVAKEATASNVAITSIEGIEATNVQAALAEISGDITTLGTNAAVTVESDESGLIYVIKQGGTPITTINIPKDQVVTDGSVVNVTAEQAGTGDFPTAEGTYIKLVIANVEKPLWIAASDLIEYVTGGANAETTVNVSDSHVVTVSLNEGGVARTKLAEDVQTSLGKADSAVQSVIVAGHELSDGSSLTAEQLKTDLGLGTAAYVSKESLYGAHFEVASEEALGELAGMKAGDIAVVKKEIATGKYEYTAYHYADNTWKAMDGNYNASNVYFDENLTYTANIGVLTVPSSGSGTIAAQGKSLEDVMKGILAKEKNPSTTQPTVALASSNIGAKEVGENVALNYSFTTKAGSYTYGPATGVTFSNHAVSLVDSNNQPVVTGAGASGTLSSIQITDGMSLTLKGTVDGSAGATPVTNLGNDYAAGKINEKTYNASVSTKLTGYRAWFYGYKNGNNALADPSAITSAQVRTLTKTNGAFPATISTTQMKQMYFLIPAGVRTTLTVADATNGAPQTVTKVASGVRVEGANNYTAKAYDLWYVDNAAAASGGATFKITVA